MLIFACVKWGTRYSAEYVNILHDMVRRNLPHGFEGKFVCFTDDPSGINDGVECRQLPSGMVGWWNKLYLFSGDAFSDGERIIYIDLDTLILAELDDIVKCDARFAILEDPWNRGHYNSSFMIWTAGEQSHIWDEWNANGRPEPKLGDQEWIEMAAPGALFLQKAFPDTFYSFKAHCYPFAPQTAKVVYFHGEPKPHDCGAAWASRVWKIGGERGLNIQMMPNVPEVSLLENVRANLKRGLMSISVCNGHGGHAVIVGSGPSLLSSIEDIRRRQKSGQTIFALNNAAGILNKNGIIPDYQVLLDGREGNLGLLANAGKYLLASQVHPSVTEGAMHLSRGTLPVLWHAIIEGIEDELPDGPGYALIGGGTTVGLSTMCLAYVMGYRLLHLYGYDSSYSGDDSHAAEQALNAGQWTINVTHGDMIYRCAPAMAAQAQKFPELAHELSERGCTITVHGNGLLPAIAHEMASYPMVSGSDLRAASILERLTCDNPVGVEVGVYLGALSCRLLQRPDLTLYMVDKWAAADADGDYIKSGDALSLLTQDRMDDVFQRAKAVVAFAGDRAKIVRADSVEAAAMVPDASLDFVFIDADHSYNGCKRDIEAWLPKLKPEGLLSGHDYDNPDYPQWGVSQAVNEYAQASGLAVELGDNFTWFIRLGKRQAIAA